MTSISPYFARKSLARLNLGEALRQHAERLLDLAGVDHRINVADIHEKLFPQNSPASANASLNRLLRQINEAAKTHGISLRAEITADKKIGAKNRWVWFEGMLEAPAPAYTSELDAIPPTQLVPDQRGFPVDELQVVILLTFNDYETDAVIKQFHPLGVPEPTTGNSIACSLLGVHGGMRIVHCVSEQGGDAAHNTALAAIHAWGPQAIIGVGIAFGVNRENQQIGDVLISKSVFGYELSRVNPDGTLTQRGLNPPASSRLLQLFRHVDQTCKADHGACLHWPTVHFGTLFSGDKLVDNKDYLDSLLKLDSEAVGGEMEGLGIYHAAEHGRVDWIVVKAICDWGDGNKNIKTKKRDQMLAAENAARVVHQALSAGNLYDIMPPSLEVEEPRLTRRSKPTAIPPSIMSMNLFDREAIPKELLIEDAKGWLTTLKKEALPEIADSPERQGVDAMEYLLQWIDEPGSPPLFALLGEYGMGKTVTCQRLAEILERRRREDPTRPLPLYFDLRHVTGLDRRVPKLQEIIEECMARGWLESSDTLALNLENFFRWVEQGAVIIFDGLDEVLVKLKEADGQVFTNEVLRLPRLVEARSHQSGGRAPLPKLLISCRTQYFRTLRD
jgi:nucleoside phosphorylase